MDDAFSFALIFFRRFGRGCLRLGLAFLMLAAARGARAEVTYVSPEQAARLAREFEAARFDATADVVGKKWSCDLFGVRSKLQVQRDVNLYVLATGKADGTKKEALVNSGDEPIAEYRVEGSSLEGHGEKGVVDQIRVTKDGRLVSRLSVPARGITVAYATCTGS